MKKNGNTSNQNNNGEQERNMNETHITPINLKENDMDTRKSVETKKGTAMKKETTATNFTAAVARVKGLLAQESTLLGIAQENKVKALFVAFDIGKNIETGVIAPYGEGKMTDFAKACGYNATKTLYNFLNLYRAAGSKEVLTAHPNLPRTYLYTVGSKIHPKDDIMGDCICRSLIQFPLWRRAEETEDPDDPQSDKVVDIGLLNDIAHYLKDLRDELKRDGILYAFKTFQWSLGKLPELNKQGEDTIVDIADETARDNIAVFTVHSDSRPAEPNIKLDSSYYVLSFRKSHQAQYEKACRSIAIKLDAISKCTGWPGRFKVDLGVETAVILENNQLAPETCMKGYRAVNYQLSHNRKLNDTRAMTTSSDEGDDPISLMTKNIVHGKAEDVLKTDALLTKMIDCVITDPPYGLYDEWRPHTKVEFDNPKTPEEAAELVGNVAKTLIERDLIKDRFIWLSTVPMDYVHVFLPPLFKAFEGKPFKHQVLVWDKLASGKAGGHQTFARQAEAILYINVGDRPLNNITVAGKREKLHPSILRHRVERKDRGNEYWKPIELMEHLIRLATGEDISEKANKQVVLDPFCGAGTTGVACLNCNRDFRMIESHEGQYEKAMRNVGLELTKAA